MRHVYLYLLTFFYLPLSAQVTESFPPPDTSITLQAQRTQTKIKIDGRLDETDWETAIPVQQFFRMEPRQGGDYLYPTSVKVLYEEHNLLIVTYSVVWFGNLPILA
jgi:hypothetical protein